MENCSNLASGCDEYVDIDDIKENIRNGQLENRSNLASGCDHYTTSALYLDCQQGSIEYIKKNIRSGQYNLKKQDFETRLSVLRVAAVNNFADIYRYLLSHLSDLDCDNYGYCGLVYVTIKEGYGKLVIYINSWFDDVDDNFSQFLNEHCVKDSTFGIDLIAFLAAFYDGQYENVCTYIDNNENLITDCVYSNGWNLLHIASMMGFEKIFSFIVSKFECIGTKDNRGNTPLHLACIKGNINIIKSMTNYEGHPINNNFETPLHLACRYGHLNAVKYFMEDTKWDAAPLDIHGFTPLHIAVIYGHSDVVKFLIKDMICGVKITDSEGNAAIHLACKYGFDDIVTYLVNYSDLSHKNHCGMTPLHIACECGHLSIIKCLIEAKKCNTSIVDANGLTILHRAASQKKSSKLLNYIVHNTECNLFSIDPNGNIPLIIACKCRNWENMRILFLEMKGDSKMTSSIWFTVFNIVFELHELGVINFLGRYIPNCLEFTDTNNNNLLHIACQHKNLGIIKELFSLWTEDERLSLLLQKQKRNRLTPLALACSNGVLSIIYFLMSNVNLDVSSFQWSILNGAYFKTNLNVIIYFCNLFEIDADGSTALHHACGLGNIEVARYLSTHGHGDIFVKNNAGYTPLECACISGHLNIIKCFTINLRDCILNDLNSHLILACIMGHFHIVKYLVEGQLFTKSIDIKKMFILKHACKKKAGSGIKYLLNHCFTTINTEEFTTLLYAACEYGNLEALKYLLNYCYTTIDAQTFAILLNIASGYGKLEVVKYLLNHCFMKIDTEEFKRVLYVACEYGNLEIVKYLVQYFQVTDINCLIHEHNNLIDSINSLLHHACRHPVYSDSLEIVEYLIKKLNLNPSLQDCENMTALHHSCASGNLEVVKVLVPLCSTADCDSEGQTALHHAASNGHLDTVKYLVSIEDTGLMYRDENSNTPLHVAIIFNQLDLVKFFVDSNYYDLNIKGEDGNSPLVLAASHQYTQTFNYLFYKQATCDCQIADSAGLMIICYAFNWGREDVIETLMQRSRNLFPSSCYKTNALLFSAVEENHLESFKYILNSLVDSGRNHPTDVLAKYAESNTNNTALHWACIYGRLDVVKYLTLDVKCDPNIINSDGFTCLHLASVHGQISIVKFLSEKKLCNALYTDPSGKSSLHFAAEHDQLEVLQYYVEELKLDPQVKDNTQNTPLHIASLRGQKVIAEYLLSFTKSVQYNIDKNTPLHLAVQNGHFDILEVLLPFALYNIYEKNKQKMSVIDYAQNTPNIARHIREIYGIEANLIPKVFIVGFPGIGKSTLFSAMQNESGLLRYITTVSKVPAHTVGVKSKEFQSKKYGTVQLYDFAGDEEYHANHQLLFQNTPLPIIILLLNLTWSEEEIISNLKYWIRIVVDSRTAFSDLNKSVKIVIIGSHYDKIQGNKELLNKLELHIKDVISKLRINEISFAKKVLFMNCKKAASAKMNDLKDQLHSICISCRAEIVKLIPFRMSLLCQKVLNMINEEMSKEIAFNIKTLCIKAREIKFIPEVVTSENEIIEYCNGLSYYGKILLLKDNEQPLKSWVILNENYILSRYHESMKILCIQSTDDGLISCGLVSLLQLQSEFEDQLEVILKYSKHFQICTEISKESFTIIPSSMIKNECQYYFFPSLIKSIRPDIFKGQPQDSVSHCYGWQLNYDEPPPPRFLQILFVQLTVPVPGAGDLQQPVFDVWKNGIHIRNNDTTECIIEVSDTLTQLIFSIRCQTGNERKLLLRRSRLVEIIHSMLVKNCPSISYSEYIFEPQHSFPVNASLKKVSLNRIAGAIIEGRTTVISSDASEYLDLTRILCSEPILDLTRIQLRRIYLHPDDIIPHSVMSNMCSTFSESWKEIKNYKDLQNAVSSHSIFIDRNVWEVANVELEPLPTFTIQYKLELKEVIQYISGHHPLTITIKEGESIRIPFKDLSSEEYCYGHYLSRCGESLDTIEVENYILFRNVRKEDAGKYELHPKHNGWSGEIQFILHVEYEPVYTFTKGTSPYFEVYEGSTQSIPFTVSSYPVVSADVKHTITFFKGSHEVPATTRFEVNDRAITLNSIQLEDSGMYQISCRTLNGQMGKAKFELHVWSQPKYKLDNSVVEVQAGTTYSIPFSVSSKSALSSPMNHILKYIGNDGKEVNLDDNFTTTQDTIILKNLKIEDCGTYQISFHNENGVNVKEQFQLIVLPGNETDSISEQTHEQTILQSYFQDIPESSLTKLDEEISDRSIRRVAYYLIHWEEKCDLFNLERNPDVEDIHDSHLNKPFMQRIEVLSRWRQRTSTPTYENLLKICLKGEFMDSAMMLVEIVKESVAEEFM